jgi:tetratricopeptide (TPR) repeat protein
MITLEITGISLDAKKEMPMKSDILIVAAALLFIACGPAQKNNDKSTETNLESVEDGEKLVERGDYGPAADLFRKILVVDPDNSQAHYYLGLAKKNLGDFAAAEQSYRRALELDSGLAAAHNNLGLLLLENGDPAGAKSELDIYLTLHPDDALAHFNFGLVLEELGEQSEATTHYQKAAELDPNDASPWFGLGDLARKNGDLEKALEMYRKGGTANPDAAELVLKEAQTLLDLDRKEKAVAVFDRLLGMPEVEPVVLATAGVLLAKHGEQERSMGMYRAAIAKGEMYPMAHFLLANALARAKQFARAAVQYEKFLSIAPDAKEAVQARKRLDVCRLAQKQVEGVQ